MAKNVFKNTYEINMTEAEKQPLLHWILAGNVLPIVDKTDKSKFVIQKFSERGIVQTISNYTNLSKIAGEVEARTIIEYLDKNKRPLVLLYPTGGICTSSPEYESDMNRETFNDLQTQLKIRLGWMRDIKKSK